MKKYIPLLAIILTSTVYAGGDRKTFQLNEIIVQQQQVEDYVVLEVPEVHPEVKLLQEVVRRLESQIIDLKHERDELEIENEELLAHEIKAHVTYLQSYLSLLRFGEVLLDENGIEIPSTIEGIKRQVIAELREVGYSVEQTQDQLQTDDN